MRLQGKTFAVLVEDHYEDQELWYPVRRLAEEGAEVVLVGPKAGQQYSSKTGYPAKADKAADDVSADQFDGLIIPGGYAPDRMRRHRAMIDLTRQMFEQGKIVAAICHAGWMLCSADILDGRSATGFSSIRVDMENAGAKWTDQEVVQDGNLITSRTPDDLPAFLRTIIESCADAEAAYAAERAHHAG
jgi:protease I